MERSNYKRMRLIVMFDLPVEEKWQQKEYRIFHKNLIKNGFFMLQYSVYVRYCNNDSAAEKYSERIKKIKPCEGNVRILRITDLQYTNMEVLSGKKRDIEEIDNTNNLIIID